MVGDPRSAVVLIFSKWHEGGVHERQQNIRRKNKLLKVIWKVRSHTKCSECTYNGCCDDGDANQEALTTKELLKLKQVILKPSEIGETRFLFR